MTAYAIIPAAGESRRMGQPKLLLPWKDGLIIDATLEAWVASRVEQVVITVRADNPQLQQQCLKHPVEVVVPEQPPADMKTSVLYAMNYIGRCYEPEETDCLLLAPADMPGLSAPLIDLVLDAHQPADPRLLAPLVDGQHGHPLLIPWQLAGELRRLNEDEGINKLWDRLPSARVDSNHPGSLVDIDTPQDYQQYHQDSGGD